MIIDRAGPEPMVTPRHQSKEQDQKAIEHLQVAAPLERPRQIVVVLGMHRSGTSLCSHVVSCLGFDMSDAPSPNPHNENGEWERPGLRDFHDRILALLDRDWYDPKHTLAFPPAWWCRPDVRAIRDEMIAWLRVRMGESTRFGFKDPRTSLLLPVWKEIYAVLHVQPCYILCVRSPAEVAKSLAARLDLPALDDLREGEHRWLSYVGRVIADLGDDPVCVISYERWFDTPHVNLRALRFALGCGDGSDPLIDDAIATVIVPDLRNQKMSSTTQLSAITRDLYRKIISHGSGLPLDPATRQVAVTCCRFETFVAPICQSALQVPELRAQLAARDEEIKASHDREAEALVTRDRERIEVASKSEMEAEEIATLRNELSTTQERLAATLAKNDELQAQLEAERRNTVVAKDESDSLRGEVARLGELNDAPA